jgi:hypothetical protein
LVCELLHRAAIAHRPSSLTVAAARRATAWSTVRT